MKHTVLRIAAITIAACSASAALADSPTNGTVTRVTARISLRDLDLRQPEHRATLDQRIARAARDACIDRSTGAPRITQGARQCMAQMMADGQAQSRVLIARANGGAVVASR